MTNHREPPLEDVVLNQIQGQPNRRILGSMDSFRVAHDTPDDMVDLLRRMEMSERQTNLQQARQR